MSLLPALLACADPEGGPRELDTTEFDTGAPQSDCSDDRCVDDLAVGLAAVGQASFPAVEVPDPTTLLVGVRGNVGDETWVEAEVAVVSLPSLEIVGTWTGGGEAVATSQAEPELTAVTATNYGAVFVVDGERAGSLVLSDETAWRVDGTQDDGLFGGAVLLSDLDGDGSIELSILDRGADYGPDRLTSGGVWSYDLPLTSNRTDQDPDRRLTGDPPYGVAMVAWDADADGIVDVVIDEYAQLGLFLGPWTTDRNADDASAHWARDDTNGAILNPLDDLDGDGDAELAVSSHTFPEPDRFGAAWLLPGGDTAGGELAAAAVSISGDVARMALGTDVSAGDLDGDGTPELLVGAAGLGARLGGLLLAFDVPVSGALTPDDAIAFAHGDFPGDSLGWAVQAVDPDDDGTSDVVACEREAGCFLVPGALLAP
jgi:hypothetical protein